MLILGIDPGLATCGFAFVKVVKGRPRLSWCRTLLTSRSPKKRGISALDDQSERIRLISVALRNKIIDGLPAVAAVEGYSRPGYVTGALALGFAWGAIIATLEGYGLPTVQLSPQTIRARLGLRKGATKDDIRRVVEETCLGSGSMISEMPKREQPHAVDAVAVALAARQSDLVRVLERKFDKEG